MNPNEAPAAIRAAILVYCKASGAIPLHRCYATAAEGNLQACQECPQEGGRLYRGGMVAAGAIELCNHASSMKNDKTNVKAHAVEVFRGLTKILRGFDTTLADAFRDFKLVPGASDPELLQATLESQATLDESMRDGVLDLDELLAFFGRVLPAMLAQIMRVHFATDPTVTDESRVALFSWLDDIREVLQRRYE